MTPSTLSAPWVHVTCFCFAWSSIPPPIPPYLTPLSYPSSSLSPSGRLADAAAQESDPPYNAACGKRELVPRSLRRASPIPLQPPPPISPRTRETNDGLRGTPFFQTPPPVPLTFLPPIPLSPPLPRPLLCEFYGGGLSQESRSWAGGFPCRDPCSKFGFFKVVGNHVKLRPFDSHENGLHSGHKSVSIFVQVIAAQISQNCDFPVPFIATGGPINLKLKMWATAARRGVNPFTKESCVLKAEPESQTVRVLPMKKLKTAVN